MSSQWNQAGGGEDQAGQVGMVAASASVSNPHSLAGQLDTSLLNSAPAQ